MSFENTTSAIISTSTEAITPGLQNQTNQSAANCCLIEPQLLFIVAACAGTLILILLTSVVVLSVKLVTLNQKRHARRSARGTVNKVSGSDHWSSEMMEKGVVGPYETNLLLEEVRNEADDDGTDEEEKAMLHQSTNTNMDGESVSAILPSSTSKDSSIDPSKELEDMPLVV